MKKNTKISFESLTKGSLKNFNIAEVQGWVIDQFVQIERRFDSIITDFYQPEKKKEFESVLLNNSILHFGSKIKVLSNIGIPKSTLEKLRKLNSIRNGFAHTRIGQSVTVFVGGTDEDTKAISESTITVMNAANKLKTKSAYDSLVEFHTLRNELREELN